METSGSTEVITVVFDNNFGLFSSNFSKKSLRNFAVLFLNTWGLEGSYIQSYQRILSEQFAAIGIAGLRFDFPGTGNAPDPPTEDMTLDLWREAVHSAVRELRRLSGARHVVLLGHGTGASIAFLEARNIDDLSGLILMNPAVNGRRYLRDISFLSKLHSMGLKAEQLDDGPGSIAGLRMAPRIAEQLQGLDLETAPPPDIRVPILIASLSSKPDQGWPANLRAGGRSVDTIPYTGYDGLVSGALPPQMPQGIGDRLCAWLQDLPAARTAAEAAPQEPLAKSVTTGAARETPVRFGTGDGLFGTVCEPIGPATGVAVLILTTALDPQAGWARTGAELARRLAALGIASLRYDSAGVADSPPIAGRRRQVLYDPLQSEDVRLAFAYLRERLQPSKCMVVGRCSGAYLAFRAVVSDPRWDACVAINPNDFRWRYRGLPRPLRIYAGKFKARGFGKAVLAGDIDLRSALHNIVVRLVDRTATLVARVFPAAERVTRRSRRVMRDFRILANRNTRVTLIYSEGDAGEGNFRIHFGRDGERLAAFPNLRVQRISNADHSLTPRPAREAMFAAIERQALELVTAPTVTEMSVRTLTPPDRQRGASSGCPEG